jgi:hypothetical protein
VGQGFGIRSLKKQESHESKIAQTNYIKHLIIGDDLSSFMLALKLYRLEQPFQIILENDVTLEMLKGKWAATFPTLRDELVYQELIQAHPALQNEQHWHSSEFYKDSKFHQFSGRVKHFEMKSSEPGFMQASKRIDYLALFTADDDNQLSAILKNNCAKKIMVEINKTTPLDLVEPNNYEVEFTDYSKIKCEHLYFARNPKLFFKLLKNKDELHESIAQYTSKLEVQSAVVVHFPLKNKCEVPAGTLFLPQSMTHEWGHFLCQFSDKSALGLSFLNEDDLSSEEELAKKIRLMRRVIERVVENFKSAEGAESIYFFEDFSYQNIDDELTKTMQDNDYHLHFIGAAAPLDSALKNAQYTERSLLCLRNV